MSTACHQLYTPLVTLFSTELEATDIAWLKQVRPRSLLSRPQQARRVQYRYLAACSSQTQRRDKSSDLHCRIETRRFLRRWAGTDLASMHRGQNEGRRVPGKHQSRIPEGRMPNPANALVRQMQAVSAGVYEGFLPSLTLWLVGHVLDRKVFHLWPRSLQRSCQGQARVESVDAGPAAMCRANFRFELA